VRNGIRVIGIGAVTTLAIALAMSASPASATTLCVIGSTPTTTTEDCEGPVHGPGGAITLTSTNSQLSIATGPFGISCTLSTLTGTAPSTTTTATVSVPVTLRYAGCTAGVLSTTITPAAACDAGGASRLTLNINANASSPFSTLTVPTGCTLTVSIPNAFCTVQITGPQTLGNGTTGLGGQKWTNGTASVASTNTINNGTLNGVSSGGSFGCPTAGTRTTTHTATYAVSTPATRPGATVEPVDRWRSTNTLFDPFTATATSGNHHVRFVTKPSTTAINCTGEPQTLVNGHVESSFTPRPNPWTAAFYAMSLIFVDCAVGATPLTVSCGGSTQWDTDVQGLAYNGGSATTQATAAARSTNGWLRVFSCNFKEGNNTCSVVTGSSKASYTNPNGNVNAGFITVVTADQALAMTAWACGTAVPAGDNKMTWGTPGAGATDLANLVYTVTRPDKTLQPIVWWGTRGG
jgi:hypothetical protein